MYKLITASPGLFIVTILIIQFITIGNQAQTVTLALNMLPLLVFILASTLTRHQQNLIDATIHATFFVYLYGVLHLTLFIIPFVDIFNSIIASDWLPLVQSYIDIARQHGISIVGLNLIPLTKFVVYPINHIQITGNLALLFPLGIYLPVLYPHRGTFKQVLIIAALTSLIIEVTQLLVSISSPHYFRTFDVDDLILNVTGACIGYGAYRLVKLVTKRL